MRLFFAAAFVFVGMMLVVALLGESLERASPLLRVLLSIGIAILFLILVATAVVLFNWGSVPPKNHQSLQELIEELKQNDLLVSTRFQAKRAFQVAEAEDEGPHYFIELEDGYVLYLNGQYLYIYDIDETGGAIFPCTDFTIRRHRTEGYVVDIVCAGRALDTEMVEITLSEIEGLGEWIPQDGDIITSRSYDELRALFPSAR